MVLAVSQSTIARLETGKRALLLVEAVRFAALYQVPLAALVPQAASLGTPRDG